MESSSTAAPHALPDPPADPKADSEEIHAFLEALKQHPGGPHVCGKTISFKTAKDKKNWVSRASYAEKYSTFSFMFTDGSACSPQNRLGYFRKPPGTWVGKSKEYSWECGDWHSFAIALVRKPGVAGKVLVIYDADCVTKPAIEEQEKPWSYRTINRYRFFHDWCRYEIKPPKLIGEVWYNQDVQYKGQGQCLQRSLEWLKEMTLLGDDALTEMDWEAAGFSKLGYPIASG